MNKIYWKTFLISGLCVLIGSSLPIVFIAFAYPDLSGDFIWPIFYFFHCLGVVLLTISLAKWRMERGYVETHKLFRALTPAQITLIFSMIILTIGVALVSLVDTTIGGILINLSALGVLVAIVLAICRVVIIFKAKRKNVSATDNGTKAYTFFVRPPDRSKECCIRCGIDLHLISPGQIVTVNGNRYCDVCGNYLKELPLKALQKEESKILEIERFYHTKCDFCGSEHPKSALILVDDKYYCEECFGKMFAAGNEE